MNTTALPTPDQINNLLIEQRKAHALLAAFYQQIAKQVSKIAEKCGYKFLWWERIGSRFNNNTYYKNPSSEDIWTFLPLSHHYYRFVSRDYEKGAEVKTQKKDTILHIHVCCDSTLDPLYNKNKETDPTKIKPNYSKSYIYLNMHYFEEDNNENYTNLCPWKPEWPHDGDIDRGSSNWSLSKNCQKTRMWIKSTLIPLADFFLQEEKIINEIKELQKGPISK